MPLKKFRPKPIDRLHTIALTNLRQEDAAKERLPDLPDGDGGTLGMPDAPGSAVNGTATNNTEATEYAAFGFRLPPNYRDNQNLTVRLRCRIVPNARNAVSNLDIIAKLIKDGALDVTDLCLTAPIDIKDITTPTDQDFTIDGDAAGDLISAGDMLHIQISIHNDDTGGGGIGGFQLHKVSVIVPSWE